MKLLGLIILFLVSVEIGNTFEALPYVHIDFAHYFRLAQCQAKCTEKYGVVATRTLLDGTERRFFNVTNDEFNWVILFCLPFLKSDPLKLSFVLFVLRKRFNVEPKISHSNRDFLKN